MNFVDLYENRGGDGFAFGKEVVKFGMFTAKVIWVETSPHEGFLKLNLSVNWDINEIIPLFEVPSIDEDLVMRFSAFDYELPKLEGWAKITD